MRSQPNQGAGGLPVDAAHEGYLGAFLFVVCLVNADLVDPQVPPLVGKSEDIERVPDRLGDTMVSVADPDVGLLVERQRRVRRSAPSVRHGLKMEIATICIVDVTLYEVCPYLLALATRVDTQNPEPVFSQWLLAHFRAEQRQGVACGLIAGGDCGLVRGEGGFRTRGLQLGGSACRCLASAEI